jgi:hemoglobin
MHTVFEAAGGNDGLLRLADAWHRRVMADDVVSHAFSHGFHPRHVERLAADVGLADDRALRQVLHDYFAWATTTTMSRYHRSADDVPDGLGIPRWSWDGLQRGM